ncbi:tetratricopeptide repeat protein 27, partial [Tanacetum coccineum]
ESEPGVVERISCCFGVDLPTIPTLRKEYADLLISCRLVWEAVKIYEDLELWDNVIFCYCLLDKKAAAVELINTRLLEKPNDPRLWCSLGDVTNQDSCYEKALQVSENKSVRAKRSLARTALKTRDLEKAVDAFTRAVQLDPDNGEAWNNIACLHMTKKRHKQALIAFKEVLKFKRDSWQMWENYGQVAVDSGNFSLALEATQKVLSLSKNKRIDVKLLERVMLEIEEKSVIGELG